MVVGVKDLGRSPGNMRTLHEHVPAPKDFGVAIIGVQEGSDMDLDLRFEAVHEGILVSGSVLVDVTGECSRCLDPLAYDLEVDVQELFFYEEAPKGAVEVGEDEEEQRWVERDFIDLEPVLRDAVVTALPFQPVCREDCQGLCSECGVHLADEPGHHHEILDPRWAALQGLTGKDN
ncbi:YceD family protein [Arthrobacter sp. 35W]|uniref:YceD family protein n=1 Tax=Arthrobacter sp. 35W TaxID=1132441 RepID=UPI0012DF9647|nr:DUF177 domain-containing protein [Arthrobacter sp. 35W]